MSSNKVFSLPFLDGTKFMPIDDEYTKQNLCNITLSLSKTICNSQ